MGERKRSYGGKCMWSCTKKAMSYLLLFWGMMILRWTGKMQGIFLVFERYE